MAEAWPGEGITHGAWDEASWDRQMWGEGYAPVVQFPLHSMESGPWGGAMWGRFIWGMEELVLGLQGPLVGARLAGANPLVGSGRLAS